MSDRPTPFTDLLVAEYHNARWPNSSQASLAAFIDSNRRFERQLAEAERQRDAAVEALKAIGDLDWPGQFSVEEYANRVLREIEGES